MKNLKPFALALTVAVMLILSGFLPEITIGGKKMRKVDLFSALRVQKELITDSLPSAEMVDDHVPKSDSFATVRVPELINREAEPDALQVEIASDTLLQKAILLTPEEIMESDPNEILDFSTDGRGMEPLYRALETIENSSAEREVRIAYFGDSYVQGDILSGDLRSLLQERFGGSGAGWVDMTSNCNYFRRTVRHEFKNWNRHLIIDSTGFNSKLQGISNSYHQPCNGAWTELKGQSEYLSHLDSASVSRIYYKAPNGGTLCATVNGSDVREFVLDSATSVQYRSVEGNIRSVRWNVSSATDSMIFFGVTMEPLRGVCLDNFSVQGSSGVQLARIPYATLAETALQRRYDLIILHFGLNVANEERTNYGKYVESMVNVVNRFKSAFPEAGILVVSVSDRAKRNAAGQMATMPAIRQLMAAQRLIAERGGVAYWNLYKAMGGEGSIVRMVNERKANYDYTHMNFKGGHELGRIMYDAIIDGYTEYEEQSKMTTQW